MYNSDEYLKPFCKGNTVYAETALAVESPKITDSENNLKLKLLYDIEKIISVKDYFARKTYEEGKDYYVEDGLLVIPSTSSVPRMKWDEYNPKEPPNDGLNAGYIDGGYVLYSEGLHFIEKQLSITYEHKPDETLYLPKLPKGKLPFSAAELKAKKPIKIGFWGDSITYGCNSSEMLGIEPFMPSWPKLVGEFIKNRYGCKVELVNKAVGGTDVKWGFSSFDEKWGDDENIDLMVVAFGTNNGPELSADEYIKYIDGICKKTADKFYGCEIIVISPCEGNRYCQDVKCHHDRLEKLYSFVENAGCHVTLAPITSLHSKMLERKLYWDMTANNINHPNDMLIRVYAQVIDEIIEEAE